MRYRVLAIPLNDISIKTVLYEIFHFTRLAMPVTKRVYPISFEGRDSPGAPPSPKMKTQKWDTGC